MNYKDWYAFSDMIDGLWNKQQKEILEIKEKLDSLHKTYTDLRIYLDKLYDKIDKLKPT